MKRAFVDLLQDHREPARSFLLLVVLRGHGRFPSVVRGLRQSSACSQCAKCDSPRFAPSASTGMRLPFAVTIQMTGAPHERHRVTGAAGGIGKVLTRPP